jgi:hypothetical protein
MNALSCVVCGSADWCACAPGTEAEARVQGNVCVLQPAPEVPLVAWCVSCWPVAHGRGVAVTK